jgi:hypothetical protein
LTETPANPQRNTAIILLVILAISITLNITQYSAIQRQTQTMAEKNNETESLTPLLTLVNMTKMSPTTRYIDGAKIVPSSILHLMDDFASHECVCDDDTVIYVPYDNVTLVLKLYLTPSYGYSQGIYLQKGNAYRNESGILVEGNPEDQKVIYDGYSTYIYNATVWQTPVIWETTAKNGETYSIQLGGHGWYTLSLWSPVHYSIGGMEKTGTMIIRDNKEFPYPPRIESWLEYKITKDGETVLFLIRHY